MVDKAYRLLVFGILVALGVALTMTVLRFLMDIGPVWALVAIAAGVIFVVKASGSET